MSCYFSYVLLFFKGSYICLVIFLMSCYFSKIAQRFKVLLFFLFARTLKVTNKTFAEEVWRYKNILKFFLSSKVAIYVLLYIFFFFARTLKLTNKTFAEQVWRYENARQFLLLLGWTIDENDGGKLVLHEMFHINDALNFLIENRFVSSSSSHLAANLNQ